MFKIESETFHDAIKPLVYFNCFAGMGAFRQPNHSHVTYFLMKLYTVIITLIHWATIYFTLNSITRVLGFYKTAPTALAMYKALLYTNSCNTVIAPLLVWLRRKGIRDCVRQMLILDATFQTVLGVQNENRKQYIRLICDIISVFSVMLLVCIYDAVSSLKSILQMKIQSLLMFWSWLQSLHDPILVMLLLDLNFCTFVGYLGKKFRDLNKCLLGLKEKSATPSPTSCTGERLCIILRNDGETTPVNPAKNGETESLIKEKHHSLREIRRAHFGLCKLSRRINLAFGIQNLLSMGISFVMITGLLYTIYSAISWGDIVSTELTEVIPSAVWTSIYAFRIWRVNHSCWSVSSEAERTGEIIYELFDSRVSDKALEKEIREFGVQMLHNPVRFNACGFFTLDYMFVQGVIGSITTYLVILIQISQVSESHVSNEICTGNRTEISENS